MNIVWFDNAVRLKLERTYTGFRPLGGALQDSNNFSRILNNLIFTECARS